MRIFTCTPVAFGGGADFFARDSGLLSRGLQSIGVESHAVMPGDRMPGDEDDLIRTSDQNLESAAWWRDQDLDGVVLYAWGRPKFRKVARAIRDAGVFLILNQDNGGLVSPLAGFGDWLAEQRNLTGSRGARWKLIVRGLTFGLFVSDPLRASHLRCGDVIACVSPKAASHYRRLCRFYGNNLTDRIHTIPHAVETRFRFSGGETNHQVACLGRWDDVVQKRPHLLMQVIGNLVARDDKVTVVIAGPTTDELTSWHAGLPHAQRMRIALRGRVGRDELADILAASRVFYSPSAYESFGIAAAEALCCGCSVVAARSVSMAAFEWFVSEQSGQLAANDPDGHLAALRHELSAWETGNRNAAHISEVWTNRLHADKVARAVVEWIRQR